MVHTYFLVMFLSASCPVRKVWRKRDENVLRIFDFLERRSGSGLLKFTKTPSFCKGPRSFPSQERRTFLPSVKLTPWSWPWSLRASCDFVAGAPGLNPSFRRLKTFWGYPSGPDTLWTPRFGPDFDLGCTRRAWRAFRPPPPKFPADTLLAPARPSLPPGRPTPPPCDFNKKTDPPPPSLSPWTPPSPPTSRKNKKYPNRPPRGGRTLRKDVLLPSKHLLSAFYKTLPSKNPSQNLVFTKNPYRCLLRSTCC